MARRTDQNQREIVITLRRMGVKVYVTSSLGSGFPDLVCSFGRKTYVVELKNGKLPPLAQKLTPLEQKFFDEWQDEVVILNSVENAIKWVNDIRKKRNGCKCLLQESN